jgi:hypothetical protein
LRHLKIKTVAAGCYGTFCPLQSGCLFSYVILAKYGSLLLCRFTPVEIVEEQQQEYENKEQNFIIVAFEEIPQKVHSMTSIAYDYAT